MLNVYMSAGYQAGSKAAKYGENIHEFACLFVLTIIIYYYQCMFCFYD